MKTNLILEMLTSEEKLLLVEALFSQNYAKEIIASELADLENYALDATKEKYQKLLNLYDHIVHYS